jgi:lysophospholipase L1-like esterase
MTAVFSRYVALGDSQTEGVGDEPYQDGTPRGWADRFAELLAAANPGLLYANLAVRGHRMADVHEQQLAPALALDPDLVSVIAGINDVIRPRFDLDATLAHMDAMQRDLRSKGATVLTATFPDMSSLTPVARLIKRRLVRFNAGLRVIAVERGAVLVDLGSTGLAADPRLWRDDRLHLNPEGHSQLAIAIVGAVGAVIDPTNRGETSTGALPTQPPHRAGQRLQAELRWAHRFLLPWIGRRLTGRSSGDGRHAKRPELLVIGPR